MIVNLDQILKERLVYPESKNLQQRGIADKIEERCNLIIKQNFPDVQDPRSRRSIEDITIGDTYVDHKSSDEALDFKMPNLISIDRLIHLDKPLMYNFIIYNSDDKTIVKNFSLNVYELNWDHLSIQNLGKGQLQIKNMKEFLQNPKSTMTKEEWIARLKTEAIAFYDKLLSKTTDRKTYWMSL
jgi:hypothetical protein